MDLKDKLESLKFISQIQRSQFDERRKLEFKILFSTLTFYILSVAAIYGGNVQLPSTIIYQLIVFILFLTIACFTICSLTSIHISNNKNKTFAENAEHKIADLINDKEQKESKEMSLFNYEESKYCCSVGDFFKLCKKRGGRSGLIWQALTIIVFAVASASLIVLRN